MVNAGDVLLDDWSFIQVLGDVMACRANELDTALLGFAVRCCTDERGQERMVDVEDRYPQRFEEVVRKEWSPEVLLGGGATAIQGDVDPRIAVRFGMADPRPRGPPRSVQQWAPRFRSANRPWPRDGPRRSRRRAEPSPRSHHCSCHTHLSSVPGANASSSRPGF